MYRGRAASLYVLTQCDYGAFSRAISDLSTALVGSPIDRYLKMPILHAILYGFFITHIYAQSNPTSFFIEPPAVGQAQLYFDNKAYAMGSTLNVKWVTDEAYYVVCLWQQNAQKVYAEVSGDYLFGKWLPWLLWSLRSRRCTRN